VRRLRPWTSPPSKVYIHVSSTSFLLSLLLSSILLFLEISIMSIPSLITAAFQKTAGQSTNGATKKPVNPLSYPKSSAPFSAELFENPTSEYRGCPFWAWNNKLDKAQLLRQIDYFEAMGMGGFHVSNISKSAL
jgi:hypothetical protein